jgi:glycosyltransferase involved in cell wall biosynthesis
MDQDLDKMTPLFSVVLIAKNEEKTLPKLIKSLSEFQSRGGEVVLLDTGSTDGTVSLAKELGCSVTEVGEKFIKVIDEKLAKKINDRFVVDNECVIVKPNTKIFDYASARNFACKLAKNDFIAMPDCDEEYTKLNIDIINQKIRDGADQFEYNFVFSHDENGNEALKFIHSKFYNRTKCTWVGIVHEVLHGNVKRTFLDESIIKLEHWQIPSENRNKYLPGLALDCYLNPDKDRNSHYFAREMFYNKFWKSAAKEFERHIAMNKWQTERGQSMSYLGECLIKINKIEEGLQQYHRATITGPPRRDGWMKLAHFMVGQNDFTRAIAYAEAALKIPYKALYTERMSQYSHEPHFLLYHSYGWVGNKIPEARHHNNMAISMDPDNKKYLYDWRYYNETPKVSIVIPSLGREESLEKLLKAIEKNANYPNYEVIVERDSFENRQGVCRTFKKAVEKSTGDLVMFLGNDCVPQKNFLIHAVRDMSLSFKNLDGLIVLTTIFKMNNGFKKFIGENSAHFLVSKKLLPYLNGEFLCLEYDHYFCDNELLERCKAIKKYSKSNFSVVLHENPNHCDDMQHDDVSKIALASYVKDLKTFVNRMKNFGFYESLVKNYSKSILEIEILNANEKK